MGLHPTLTKAERTAIVEELKALNLKRAALRAEIARLRAELRAIPNNVQFSASHGISPTTLRACRENSYKSQHPADLAAEKQASLRELNRQGIDSVNRTLTARS